MDNKNFEAISAEDARRIIAETRPLVVDIRDQAAFAEAHIQDAIHVDDTNVADFVSSADKGKPLVCYCYHGISSRSAAQYFLQQGFKQVYSIDGGFEAWRAVYPSVSS